MTGTGGISQAGGNLVPGKLHRLYKSNPKRLSNGGWWGVSSLQLTKLFSVPVNFSN